MQGKKENQMLKAYKRHGKQKPLRTRITYTMDLRALEGDYSLASNTLSPPSLCYAN